MLASNRKIPAICVLAAGLLLALPSFSQSHIRGTVRTSTQTALSNVLIRVFTDDWIFISNASTRTLSDGSFTTGELNPGRYYLRAVPEYPQPYVAAYWPSALEREEAITIMVEQGIDTYGIEFQLIKGGFIRGSIQNTNGLGVPSCDLDLYNELWHWYVSLTAKSEANGEYIMGALPPGKYYLRADPAADRYLQQIYWPQSYYRTSAQILSIFEGSDISDINFTLLPGGAFSGFVQRDVGGALPNCEIIVFNTDWIEQPIHQAMSDVNGEYFAFGLPAGSYYAEARPANGSGSSSEYFDNTTIPTEASAIQIVEQESLTGIDFDLPEGNYDFHLNIRMPARHFSAGIQFSTNLDIRNDGTPHPGMPVFFLLEFNDTYFFWPSWRLYNPPTAPYIDYALIDLTQGENQIVIFDPFVWPELGLPETDVQFLAAVTTRSFNGLASDLETVNWSFE